MPYLWERLTHKVWTPGDPGCAHKGGRHVAWKSPGPHTWEGRAEGRLELRDALPSVRSRRRTPKAARKCVPLAEHWSLLFPHRCQIRRPPAPGLTSPLALGALTSLPQLLPSFPAFSAQDHLPSVALPPLSALLRATRVPSWPFPSAFPWFPPGIHVTRGRLCCSLGTMCSQAEGSP